MALQKDRNRFKLSFGYYIGLQSTMTKRFPIAMFRATSPRSHSCHTPALRGPCRCSTW